MKERPENLKIIKAVHNENGTTTLEFEITKEFEEWFLDKTKMETFCHEEFERFIVASLNEG